MSIGISMERVDEIIDSYGALRHQLIAIMQDIQAEYKYLSPEVLERIIETAVNYAVQFDMLVPPYEKVKRVNVEPFNTKDETPKIPTGKRINHEF